jgi:2-polyprenyl-3-methyl-5-hydroxy-6-metoxy-1,4-benzoquinol methylase
MDDPVAWHSRIAADFEAAYERSARFRERRAVWAELIGRHLREGGAVLDAGCGPGVLTELAAARAGRVVALDPSADMAARARARLAANRTEVEAHQAPIAAIGQFGRGAFDLVMCSSVIEYLDDVWTAIEQMGEALKSGGVLIVSAPNRHSLYRGLERAAFTVFGAPAYLAHVRPLISRRQLVAGLEQRGLSCIEEVYYGQAPVLGWALRRAGAARLADTMLALACRKA